MTSRNAYNAAFKLTHISDVDLVRGGLATLDDACAYLQCSRPTLYRLFKRGLPYAQRGERRIVPWRALHEYAASIIVRRDRAVAS